MCVGSFFVIIRRGFFVGITWMYVLFAMLCGVGNVNRSIILVVGG